MTTIRYLNNILLQVKCLKPRRFLKQRANNMHREAQLRNTHSNGRKKKGRKPNEKSFSFLSIVFSINGLGLSLTFFFVFNFILSKYLA